jgi:hypothetical protein
LASTLTLSDRFTPLFPVISTQEKRKFGVAKSAKICSKVSKNSFSLPSTHNFVILNGSEGPRQKFAERLTKTAFHLL